MSQITIYAGDFPQGTGHFTFRSFTLPSDESRGICSTFNVSELDLVHQATKEMAMLLEPSEELNQLIDNHDKDEVMFMARFKAGKRFIGMTNQATFDKIIKSHKLCLSQNSHKVKRAVHQQQAASV